MERFINHTDTTSSLGFTPLNFLVRKVANARWLDPVKPQLDVSVGLCKNGTPPNSSEAQGSRLYTQ
jgi:hypothetical protein